MGLVLAETISDVRGCIHDARRRGASIGFVPTMGALHEGHWSLIERARGESDVTVVSIFVNPLQFSAGEDFDEYPRTRDADLAGCAERGVDIVFCPSIAEMYGQETLTGVHVRFLSEPLCGRFRPGHFDGVCTVVCKLFNVVAPDKAYFGEKDYQQLVVVRRMVQNLSIPVEVIACPTVRERDGLALSSRNANLSPATRARASVMYEALAEAARAVAEGERDAAALAEGVTARIEKGGAVAIDYVSVVDPETLEAMGRIDRPARICAAARFDHVRLIDNVFVDGGATPE